MLDDIMLYWLTNSATSSARFYWENANLGFYAVEIGLPVGVTVFPREIYRAPRSWAERTYRKLVYWNEVDRGGHFVAAPVTSSVQRRQISIAPDRPSSV
jgi:hypothetical protein